MKMKKVLIHIAGIPGFGFIQTLYIQDTGDLHEKVDFVACLGGDGVILHASNLFRGAVPPVVRAIVEE
ncbi:NAD kinase 2, chloroplastic [Trifolium repens]|nr:NAD kinase 2, chloroplastic [Trifolium repens]